jgi:hypothetical protein
MIAPRKTAGLPPHPNKASVPVQSCVHSAQISPAQFKPDMEKGVTSTESATVGVNPNPPAQRQQSAGPADPVIPYSGYLGGYSPFGLTAGGTVY